MAEHKLSYTASEIDERLGKVSSLVAKINGITPDSTGNVTLPIDTSIQQNSTNPVTGGALYNELSEFAEDVRAYVEDNAPTKTSQLTNDSGFITGIPSEYITESELTAKGYATQASVTALSNRIDNLPTGGNITVDSELSETSTNPVQNKVITEAVTLFENEFTVLYEDLGNTFENVYEDLDAMQNEIDNLSASGDKTLIGEITLNNTNLTVDENHDGTGFYNIGTDLQTTMTNVFSKLDEGFGALVAELIMLDCTITVSCNRSTASKAVNVAESINCIIPYDTENGTAAYFSFLNNHIRANDIAQGYITNVLNGIMTLTVKFYTIGGSSAQPDWNQNDSSAPDYIKNRPFYKETETIFDDDVTTVIDENDGMIVYEHDSSIIDLESVQDGDLFEVIFGDMAYLYEIKDMPFLGNFYLFVEQQAAGLDMTIEEYLELISQHMPEMAELAVDTGEDFLVGLDTGTLFITKEAGTYHFTINKVTDIKKLDSSMIDWAGGGAPSGLPEVTTEDNDKVLMVVDGKWVVGSIANGDEVYY